MRALELNAPRLPEVESIVPALQVIDPHDAPRRRCMHEMIISDVDADVNQLVRGKRAPIREAE